MTLRARLLVGVVLVFVALTAVGLSVSVVQSRYLTDQLDQQLEPIARNAGRPGAGPAGGPRGPLGVPAASARQAPRLPADVFYGVIGLDGAFVTHTSPASDPALVPDVPVGRDLSRPTTLSTRTGNSEHVRAIAITRPDGTRVMIAISTKSADDALRRLEIALLTGGLVVIAVVGLVVLWVIRFGLRPIRHMTDAADAITAGALDRRVEVGDVRTEAGKLGQALNVMIDTSQAAQEKLRRFVADASHELRTPLTTLRGYTELYHAHGYADSAALDDAMRRMNHEAIRMNRMVDDLLMLAQLDEGEEHATDVVDLTMIVREVASDMKAIQPERTITTELPDHLIVSGDAHHLTQAVAALTTNALRHTPADTPIEIHARAVDGAARVEVVDHGPGIDEAHVPHLFDRFYRVDVGRARDKGGHGLGLAIVSSIVAAHGGRCGATSHVGSGSTFWIEIPLLDRWPGNGATSAPLGGPR